MSTGIESVDNKLKEYLGGEVNFENNFHSFSLVPESVYTNDCIGIVPSQVMKARTINRKLFHVLDIDDLVLPSFTLYQFWRGSSSQDNALKQMRQTIQEICGPHSNRKL